MIIPSDISPDMLVQDLVDNFVWLALKKKKHYSGLKVTMIGGVRCAA